MSDFVGQDRLQFDWLQLIYQCIKQNYFAEPAQPGKERVGVP